MKIVYDLFESYIKADVLYELWVSNIECDIKSERQINSPNICNLACEWRITAPNI